MKLRPTNAQFAGIEDDYLLMSYYFAVWMRAESPPSGYKIHISVMPDYAEITARSVLPKLIDLRIAHKVIKNFARYMEFHAGENRGKFITIYTKDINEMRKVVDAIDEELMWMMGGSAAIGPTPTTRSSNHTQPENRIGASGLIFWREFSDND